MKPSLEWGTFFDKEGVPHIIPMYGKNHPQPGHSVDSRCNCHADLKKFPNKVIVIHRVIH